MKPEDAEEYTQALGQVAAGAWRQVALGERLGVPRALGLSTREWVEQRLGGYVRLSVEERRSAVKELTDEGLSTRKIGEIVGVSHQAVANDVKNLTAPPADTLDLLAGEPDVLAREQSARKQARAAVDAATLIRSVASLLPDEIGELIAGAGLSTSPSALAVQARAGAARLEQLADVLEQTQRPRLVTGDRR